jgi:hypothetical protein
LTQEEHDLADDDFEVRADHVDEDTLREGTVTDDWFEDVYKVLVGRQLVLLVGPRGCGKTHMMRFTLLKCVEDSSHPLAIYVSFNRYLRLEPLLKVRVDATALFTTWVLGRLVLALLETTDRIDRSVSENVLKLLGLDLEDIQDLVGRLERGSDISVSEETRAQMLTVDAVVDAIRRAAADLGRSRTVVFMDDAALTLTPDYLVEFFDVVRALKKTDVAPKCSVYPGSTEYGPRFHATHEGRIVPAWLSVDHPRYVEIMRKIGMVRYPEGVEQISDETNEALMYTAFGVPRAYLTLLRSIVSDSSSSQLAFNRAVQEHRDAKVSEYHSLERKMPRYETLIKTGAEFFGKAVDAMRTANEELTRAGRLKQLLLGIEADDFDPLTTRMVRFLIEVGLLYEHPEVSHGEQRTYRRFTPHLAALIASRAFAGGSRAGSAATVVAALRRKNAKHPVRRKLNTLLPKSQLAALKLDLPPCTNCATARVSEQQRFCAQCGAQLSDPSTFAALMVVSVDEVTGLSEWRKKRLREHGILTIGALLAHQDPGTELRKIHRVGAKRAEQIVSAVQAHVDEYLS